MVAERQLNTIDDVRAAAKGAHGAVLDVVDWGGWRAAGGGSYEHCVVLCKIANARDPYAVWMLVAPGADEIRRPYLVTGDYCSTIERARECFEART